MGFEELKQRIDTFYKLAAKDTASKVLKELSSLETFKDRVDYAEKQLKHLSSGSSRVIYVMPDGKQVLKLAKNDRGVAQNIFESKLKNKYVNKTTKSDPDGVWKISPMLDKVTEKEFEELTGLDFKDFGKALEFGLKDVSKSKVSKPKNFEEVSKSEIYKTLVEFGKKNDLMPGDLSRISSWGKIDKQPILLDAGLNKEIYDEFY